MGRWKNSFFSPHRYEKNAKIVWILPLISGTGVIVHIELDDMCVASYRIEGGGWVVPRQRVAQLAPEAGVPNELLLTKVINDIREIVEHLGKLEVFVD